MAGLNLEHALRRERRRMERSKPHVELQAFQDLLRENDAWDQELERKILSENQAAEDLDLRKLDPQRLYHIDHIKQLCTNYRLRFLDAHYFKAQIPVEAIQAVKALQRNTGKELGGFRIMAPAPMFNLERKDRDPLLFIPLSDSHYYLVHKWGKDLNPLRYFLVYPLRNFQSMLLSLALLAFLIQLMVPSSVMMGPLDETSFGIRVIFFFYLFIAFSGLAALYGFSRMKDFNETLWNSRYTD